MSTMSDDPEQIDRDDYRAGLVDGGLLTIAAAFGLPGGGQMNLMGRPIRITVEWVNGEPDARELDTLAAMVKDALDRRDTLLPARGVEQSRD